MIPLLSQPLHTSLTACIDVTGSPSARKAIVHVYDLFGYSPQTYQGADILATKGSEPYLVFVSDFIGPDRTAQHEWFLRGADQKPLQDLLAIVTSNQMMADIHATAAALRSDEKYGHVQRWAGVGFCWGTKGISLIAAKENQSLLDVTALTSPSRLDPVEARTITVPTMLLTSNGEDEIVAGMYCENLKGPKYFERFDETHGWMSARYVPSLSCGQLELCTPLADLEDTSRGKLDQEQHRREYERGYQLVLGWLAKYL